MSLRRRILPTPAQAVRAAKIAGITTVSAQVGVAITLTAIDEVRKRRAPGGGGFPALAPLNTNVGKNQVRTYTEGSSLYSDMLAAIENATDYIYFETFIWKSDKVGQRFKQALIRAAHRGVKVFCTFDGFGNLVVNPAFKRFPKHPNLHVIILPTVRLGALTLNIRKTGRDHRKVLVVDGNIGFVGGYNIGTLYEQEWRDTHVRIKGPAVWELEMGFVDYWNARRWKHMPALPDQGARAWESNIYAALNQPNKMLFPVRGLYIDALERANDRALITSAYFIPDREILAALVAAAKRGVKIKVLVPERSNHVVADWISRAYYDDLIAAGIEIWQYQHAMIHAKTATVDGRWATVGTANIDRLSMYGNYEINIQTWSRSHAKQMEQIFENDLSTSVKLSP
ncbi:MAG: phospholipase D-like domain-containing protein, partial [Actinomycetaceae bacterium]|nr:phospholipase D-like domain-containing protein [Actinomycetaceae bacterium]